MPGIVGRGVFAGMEWVILITGMGWVILIDALMAGFRI